MSDLSLSLSLSHAHSQSNTTHRNATRSLPAPCALRPAPQRAAWLDAGRQGAQQRPGYAERQLHADLRAPLGAPARRQQPALALPVRREDGEVVEQAVQAPVDAPPPLHGARKHDLARGWRISRFLATRPLLRSSAGLPRGGVEDVSRGRMPNGAV